MLFKIGLNNSQELVDKQPYLLLLRTLLFNGSLGEDSKHSHLQSPCKTPSLSGNEKKQNLCPSKCGTQAQIHCCQGSYTNRQKLTTTKVQQKTLFHLRLITDKRQNVYKQQGKRIKTHGIKITVRKKLQCLAILDTKVYYTVVIIKISYS